MSLYSLDELVRAANVQHVPTSLKLLLKEAVPVEPVEIRWCLNHRRETWSGRTTCVGMGSVDMCNVVDAVLVVGGE